MFPLTSSNIAQTLGLGPSARLGRRATASAVIVGAAAIALLAFAHTSANAAENSSPMAREHHVGSRPITPLTASAGTTGVTAEQVKHIVAEYLKEHRNSVASSIVAGTPDGMYVGDSEHQRP